MRRPEREYFHDNHERWLISYADFITLLFAFFVVMYALSSPDDGKYRLFKHSLSTAFTNKPVELPSQSAPRDDEIKKALVTRRNAQIAEQIRKQQEEMQAIARDITNILSPLVKSGQVTVTQSPRGVKIEINANALFDQGQAKLLPAAVEVLSGVAVELRGGTQSIEVDGYTDDVPISNSLYPSNWELSSARACSVVRLFIDHGVDGSRLAATGYADNRPVESNSTPEGRARNRRVAVTILAPAQPGLEQALQSGP
jgi:chemotaxis protein MotB